MLFKHEKVEWVVEYLAPNSDTWRVASKLCDSIKRGRAAYKKCSINFPELKHRLLKRTTTVVIQEISP